MASVIVNPRRHFAPLLDAMVAAGGSLPASQVLAVMGIADKRNLARSLRPAISAGLIEQTVSGWRSTYAVIQPLPPIDQQPEAREEFNAVLYLDGTLNMSGFPVDDDGHPLLSREMAGKLKALLNGEAV